jgi:hypothetical protein
MTATYRPTSHTEFAGFDEVLAGVLQRVKPAALAQPLDVYARAVVAYPALRGAVDTVLSGNLETDLLSRATQWHP